MIGDSMQDRPKIDHLPDAEGTLERHRAKQRLARGAAPAPNVIRHLEPAALGHAAMHAPVTRRVARPIELDELDPMRVSAGVLYMTCRTMARRDLKGIPRDARDDVAADAVCHLIRWESQGADVIALGGAERLPLRRDWYVTREDGRRETSPAAWRACRAAVKQAADENRRSAIGAEVEEPADPDTLPALGTLAQSAEPDPDAFAAPPIECVALLVESIGCPENAARALIIAADEGARRASERGSETIAGPTDAEWAERFGIAASSMRNVRRARDWWRESFPDAGDLIAAVRDAISAAATCAADHARAEAADLAAGYGDPKAARRALLVYAETAGTIPAKRRAALVAAYRASGWRMAPKDAAAIVAGLTRLVGAEELRAATWATVRGRGSFAAGVQSFASTGAAGWPDSSGRIRTWDGGTPAGADDLERDAIRERLQWRADGRRNPYLPIGSRG